MKLAKILKYALTVTAAALLLHGAAANAADKKSPAKEAPAKEKAAPAKAERTIKLEVTEDGYVPSPIKLKKDEPVVLMVTRKTDKTCATELVMKDYNINRDLPLNQEVAIRFTPSKTGTLKYGCGMGQMIAGQFLIE
jgi:plastocyanin domain-containing protein